MSKKLDEIRKRAVQDIIDFADAQIARGWRCCGRCLSLNQEHISQIYTNAQAKIDQILSGEKSG